MNQVSVLTLDRLPPPPELNVSAPGIGDSISDVINAGLALVETLSAKADKFESYDAQLAKELHDLCKAAEQSEVDPDILRHLSDQLLNREREQARRYMPALETLAEARQNAAGLGRNLRSLRNAFVALVDRFEDTLAGELELYRDTRLRLDRRRAEIINRSARDVPTFDSGDAAAAYIRSIRR